MENEKRKTEYELEGPRRVFLFLPERRELLSKLREASRSE